MKRQASRSKHSLRRHKPFVRRLFDAAWRAVIAKLTQQWIDERQPGFVDVDEDGNILLRLPDGRSYAGQTFKAGATTFRVGTVHCRSFRHAHLDLELNADGGLPVHRPDNVEIWPLQVKIFPSSKDGLVRGLVWLPDRVGRSGGTIYRLTMRSDRHALRGVTLPLSVYTHVDARMLESYLGGRASR